MKCQTEKTSSPRGHARTPAAIGGDLAVGMWAATVGYNLSECLYTKGTFIVLMLVCYMCK
jgi:hypothetical protein